MLGGFCNSIAVLVVIGVAMGVFERIAPASPSQRFLRSGFVTDLIYWLTPYFLYGPLSPKALTAVAHALGFALTGSSVIGFAFVIRQPSWAQALEAFLLADFLSYWAHRWLHGRNLWAFHAIHHGVVELDWLSTIRNHPVNVVLQRLRADAAACWRWASPSRRSSPIAPFSAMYNIFTHANVDWRFGPLAKIFVSPTMHRWHHSVEAQGCNANFGEALAIWDVMFGTFYLPDHLPQRLGLAEGPPEDFVGQTLWPLHYFLDSAPETAKAG